METERLSENAAMRALMLAQSEWGGEVRDGKLVPSPEPLLSDTEVVDKVEGFWFVASADSRKEREAVKSVAALGFPAYRPIVVKYEVVRGRRAEVERSMFGCYFFVKCISTEQNYHRIRLARYVRSLVTTADGHWLSVPDDAMDIVRAKEASFADPSLSSKFVWHFSPGDMVRIKSGPFAYFHAQLESAVDEHGRIAALIEIFGRQTRVQLEAKRIEAT